MRLFFTSPLRFEIVLGKHAVWKVRKMLHRFSESKSSYDNKCTCKKINNKDKPL